MPKHQRYVYAHWQRQRNLLFNLDLPKRFETVFDMLWLRAVYKCACNHTLIAKLLCLPRQYIYKYEHVMYNIYMYIHISKHTRYIQSSDRWPNVPIESWAAAGELYIPHEKINRKKNYISVQDSNIFLHNSGLIRGLPSNISIHDDAVMVRGVSGCPQLVLRYANRDFRLVVQSAFVFVSSNCNWL